MKRYSILMALMMVLGVLTVGCKTTEEAVKKDENPLVATANSQATATQASSQTGQPGKLPDKYVEEVERSGFIPSLLWKSWTTHRCAGDCPRTPSVPQTSAAVVVPVPAGVGYPGYGYPGYGTYPGYWGGTVAPPLPPMGPTPCFTEKPEQCAPGSVWQGRK